MSDPAVMILMGFALWRFAKLAQYQDKIRAHNRRLSQRAVKDTPGGKA
ncbi:MAG: hypothetical protein KGL39_58355 [Patescibacteria group bacterium]|nr:hypothetical protein [Patescibacteria group bacterium]